MNSSFTSFSPARAVLLTLAAALGLLLGACQNTSESHAFTGISGDKIGDDYIYYPSYEVYYIPARRTYVYYDGQTWVTTAQPSTVWAKDIAAAPSVRMDFHDSPEHHHGEISRQYPRTWVPGERARTTNDDYIEGKSTRR